VPTIEIDRVRRQGPDGSLYVTAADAAAPGAAALQGFDGPGALPPMAATDTEAGIYEVWAAVTALPSPQIISGSGAIGGGGTLVVAVGVAYNGKPAVATYAVPNGVNPPPLSAVVAAGSLTITSAVPNAGSTVHWMIDGR